MSNRNELSRGCARVGRVGKRINHRCETIGFGTASRRGGYPSEANYREDVGGGGGPRSSERRSALFFGQPECDLINFAPTPSPPSPVFLASHTSASAQSSSLPDSRSSSFLGLHPSPARLPTLPVSIIRPGRVVISVPPTRYVLSGRHGIGAVSPVRAEW